MEMQAGRVLSGTGTVLRVLEQYDWASGQWFRVPEQHYRAPEQWFRVPEQYFRVLRQGRGEGQLEVSGVGSQGSGKDFGVVKT
jgi:hypothetical protein